jgi:hypothetical protein
MTPVGRYAGVIFLFMPLVELFSKTGCKMCNSLMTCRHFTMYPYGGELTCCQSGIEDSGSGDVDYGSSPSLNIKSTF